MSRVSVRIPTPLRDYTDRRDDVDVEGGTVGAVMESLVALFPRLRRHLMTEDGALRSHVNLYLNEEDVRQSGGHAAAVSDGDVVTIVPSIAGGEVAEPAAEELGRAESLRYARHLVLDEVGPEGQRKLKAARVLIVGAGGLGSPAGLYLAAAGVGTIGLVDFDDVEASNLQRQVLYGESDLGRPKLDAAAERLEDLNPHVRIVRHPVRLSSENALDIIRDYDLVIDGTDNFPTRYLVNDACVLLGKRNVYGSILKFEGQVSVFGGDEAPCYRCLFRQPPPPGLVPNCAEGGVLGVLPGIIGSLQALETIKLITGAGEPLIGRLLLFDALKLRWRELKLRRNPDCPVCGDDPTVTELIDYDLFCGLESGTAAVGTGTDAEDRDDRDDREMDAAGHDDRGTEAEGPVADQMVVAELKQRLDRGEEMVLIDVREPFEWTIANLGEFGARMIPMNELPARLDELDPADEIVLYCRSGSRSDMAMRYLRERGYHRARNLAGGILAWGAEFDPSVPRY